MTKIFAGGVGDGHRSLRPDNGSASMWVVCHLHSAHSGEVSDDHPRLHS